MNINIGDEVKINANVVDYNEGSKKVKLKINGYDETKTTITYKYIWVDYDDIKNQQGKWITNMGSYSTPKCSICGWDEPYSEDSSLGVLNYCPNCGAEMLEYFQQ